MNEYEKKELEDVWTDTLLKINARRTKRRMFAFAGASVACVAIALAAGFVLSHGHRDVPAAETLVAEADIVLEDGTKVKLTDGSRLFYPNRFGEGERTVRLDGEAYFEVSSSVEHPFVVQFDGGSVRVTGTKFLAEAYPGENVRVILDEGRVELTAGDCRSVRMLPSQEICMDVSTGEIIEDYIVFKDERLGDIMQAVSALYSVGYRFSDESLSDVRLSCRLPRYDDVTRFMSLVEIVCRLRLHLADGTIFIDPGA